MADNSTASAAMYDHEYYSDFLLLQQHQQPTTIKPSSSSKLATRVYACTFCPREFNASQALGTRAARNHHLADPRILGGGPHVTWFDESFSNNYSYNVGTTSSMSYRVVYNPRGSSYGGTNDSCYYSGGDLVQPAHLDLTLRL